jgi:shikimate dehydrogenase
MKKYLVIGNPIEHSLSPKLHNYWIKVNGINAIYEKKKLSEDKIEDLILQIREKKIHGVNVTVPFKNKVIPYLDKLTLESKSTQSVNTIYLNNNQIVGHNTDIYGFEMSIKKTQYNLKGKKILILGSGGVVPSIIFALKKKGVSQIVLSNRTRGNAEKLKDLFQDVNIINWGEITNFDMVINATSLGLNKGDRIEIDFSSIGKDKFFYDVIYNSRETHFLKLGRELGNKTENGEKMFIYQAYSSFNIWHGIYPIVNDEVTKLLNQ